MTKGELDALIAARAQESLLLEIKDGTALDKNARLEIVKDVSGFANAAGGTLIYGLAEVEVDGITAAGGFAPVKSGLGKDWLTSILRSNTMPPLSQFSIAEVAIEGGIAVIVTIEAGSTAHQNLIDRKYYQRAGVSTEAMVDFQIRDVMNRRTRPLAQLTVGLSRISTTAQLHRRALTVRIENVGLVSLDHWWLVVDIPQITFRDTRAGYFSLLHAHRAKYMARATAPLNGIAAQGIAFGDPLPHGAACVVHPGQVVTFEPNSAEFPEFVLEVDDDISRQIERPEPPIRWTLYTKDAPPQQGELAFDDWCQF